MHANGSVAFVVVATTARSPTAAPCLLALSGLAFMCVARTFRVVHLHWCNSPMAVQLLTLSPSERGAQGLALISQCLHRLLPVVK